MHASTMNFKVTHEMDKCAVFPLYMNDASIFNDGTPRSGTTLLANILGRHTSLFMTGETLDFEGIYFRAKEIGNVSEDKALLKIATRLYEFYDRYIKPDDQGKIARIVTSPAELADKMQGSRDYGEVLERFMGIQMQITGKARWGNNAPQNLFSAKEIKQFFPEAKLIICVRDIRGSFYSYKCKWMVVSEEQIDRLKRFYHSVVESYL